MKELRLNFNSAHHIVRLSLLIVLATPPATLGLELGGWDLAPVFSVETEYADNPVLGEDKNSGLVTLPSAGLLLRRYEERWKANLGAQLDYVIFTGVGNIPNIDNQQVNLNSSYSLTERMSFGLDGRLRRDNLIRQRVFLLGEEVFDPIDPVELEDADIGLVAFTLRRNMLHLRPSWQYQLTERMALGANYTFLDISFAEPPGEQLVRLVGTEAHRWEARTSYLLATETTLNLGADVLRVSAEDTQTDTLAVLGGINYPLSEVLTSNLEVGYRVSSTEFNDGGKERTSGFIGLLGIQYNTELSQFQGVITRRIAPGGRGFAQQLDRVTFEYLRSILPRLALSLSADGFIGEPMGVPIDSQTWLEARSGLTWNWTRWWAVEAGYTYRRRAIGDFSADSNGVFAAITYTPPRPGM
jgi:hypothetical protein